MRGDQVMEMRGWCGIVCFFFQAEDGIRDLVRSRGLGDVYKRQALASGRSAVWVTATVTQGRPLTNSAACTVSGVVPVSYTHLTLPTIYPV